MGVFLHLFTNGIVNYQEHRYDKLVLQAVRLPGKIETEVNQTGKNILQKYSGKVSKRENKKPFTEHAVKAEIFENNLIRLIISQVFH